MLRMSKQTQTHTDFVIQWVCLHLIKISKKKDLCQDSQFHKPSLKVRLKILFPMESNLHENHNKQHNVLFP